MTRRKDVLIFLSVIMFHVKSSKSIKASLIDKDLSVFKSWSIEMRST